MQQTIHDFQNLLKEGSISIPNEYLKETLYKFDFIFYPDIVQTEKKVKPYENNSKIIIIDECMENGIKYYVVCFDYKLIILPQEDTTNNLIFPQEDTAISLTLPSIFTGFEDSDKYFIQNNSEDANFFYEIRNFSKEFTISNEEMKHFWKIGINCISGFLIKKGYQNSRNSHDKYLNDKFVEHEEKNLGKKSYIELRSLGQGSGGIVYLIYYISKEEVFALKIPFDGSNKWNERERRNYLSIRYPYIVPYIGYIEYNNQSKYLLLEYVEGETLDEYDLSSLNEQEKDIIILELLLTIHYLHSQKYIYRDLRLSNIMINQNKDVILIDFDHVRKVDDETDSLIEDNEQTQDFNGESVAPDIKKSYKSDVYSLGYIIHFILYGKVPKINNINEIKEDFIFKVCLEKDQEKRPSLRTMTDIFYSYFLIIINSKVKKNGI